MNKRYIDFVPSKQGGAGSASQGVSGRNRVTTTKTQVSSQARMSSGAMHKVVPASAPKRTRRVVSAATPRTSTGSREVRQAQRIVKPAQKRLVQATPGISHPNMRKVVNATDANVARKQRVAKSAPTVVAARGVSSAPALGVVEDLNSRFVKTDVPKRPLSQAPEPGQAVLAEAKAKKLRGFRSTKKNNKAIEKTKTSKNGNQYQPPKTPFINQNKVEKRPLSRKVAPKKKLQPVIAPKEAPKGPVAIIEKPKKESHVGIIVTIIITIILGAAAGTIAFLLLPK